MQISVREPEVAKEWLRLVQGINEDYFQAMKDAGDTLVDMQNFCEGTVVDDLVNYGTAILDAAQATFNAIDKIAETVTSILNSVSKFTEDVVGGITSALGKVFGK